MNRLRFACFIRLITIKKAISDDFNQAEYITLPGHVTQRYTNGTCRPAVNEIHLVATLVSGLTIPDTNIV